MKTLPFKRLLSQRETHISWVIHPDKYILFLPYFRAMYCIAVTLFGLGGVEDLRAGGAGGGDGERSVTEDHDRGRWSLRIVPQNSRGQGRQGDAVNEVTD